VENAQEVFLLVLVLVLVFPPDFEDENEDVGPVG
jgi:hypothetical protein